MRAMLSSRDRLGALLLLIFFSIYGWLALDIPAVGINDGQAFTASTLPLFLCAAGVGLALLLCCTAATEAQQHKQRFNWGRFAVALLLMVVYAASLRPAGFVASTMLFLFLSFVALQENEPKTTGVPDLLRVGLRLALVSALVTGLFWLLLTQALGVYLPAWPAS